MHPGEHEIMARVEADHWWYRGLRDTVARTLERLDPPLPASPRVLDAGCGTGANLALVRDRFAPGWLGGFDTAPEALRLARRLVPEAELYAADLCDPEPRGAPLDLILCLDVIYIPGIERARPGLARLVTALVPGGRLVVNLPAYDWLYSEHDVAIHTTERYTARRVRRLLDELGLEIERLSYRLSALLPFLALSRLARRRRARPGDPAARSDLHRPPPPWLNTALLEVVRAENRLIARGVGLPWGSSVFAVGRRPTVLGASIPAVGQLRGATT